MSRLMKRQLLRRECDQDENRDNADIVSIEEYCQENRFVDGWNQHPPYLFCEYPRRVKGKDGLWTCRAVERGATMQGTYYPCVLVYLKRIKDDESYSFQEEVLDGWGGLVTMDVFVGIQKVEHLNVLFSPTLGKFKNESKSRSKS